MKRPAGVQAFIFMVMPVCRLCLQDKKLIKSHIIPDFMYKALFDANHKMYMMSHTVGQERNIRFNTRFTGDYERLLCENCDQNIVGRYESYASTVFSGGTVPKIGEAKFKHMANGAGVEYVQVSNVDYRDFKLFLLAILWRASITSRDIYQEISLGVQHEETIRKMLLLGDAGDEDVYPVNI